MLDEDLYSMFESCTIGSFSDEIETIHLQNKSAVSLVLVNKNKQNKENVITGLDNIDEETLVTYYPDVAKNRYLEYEANTGSVLVLTSSASTSSRMRLKRFTPRLKRLISAGFRTEKTSAAQNSSLTILNIWSQKRQFFKTEILYIYTRHK